MNKCCMGLCGNLSLLITYQFIFYHQLSLQHRLCTQCASPMSFEIEGKFSQPNRVSRPRVSIYNSVFIHVPKAAATPDSAIRLCPHACPTSGKASYSQINPTVRPPSSPVSARKAVSKV